VLTEADVRVANDIDRAELVRGFRWQYALPTDLDRDGRGDVIVGASGQDSVHVFHGRTLPMPQRSTADSDVQATSSARGSGFGAPVAAGDMDGDGFSDLIVGAPLEGAGAVYFFAGPLTSSMPSMSTSDARLVLRGEGTTGFGRALCLGDVDRNGFLDLLVGSGGTLGQAFLYLGGPEGLEASPVLLLTSPNAGDDFGAALALGDLDGDGWSELVVGAPNALGPRTAGRAAERVGAVVVYRGAAELGGEGTPWLTLFGREAGARFGEALALGDLRGDAAAELVVGAPASGGGAGAVHLYTGSADFAGDAAAAVLAAEGAHDRLGAALATGDIDGDGRHELVVGAPEWNGIGRAYLFRLADELVTNRAGEAAARLMAPLSGASRFGSAVALVDVDGNGREDLVITAPDTNDAPGHVYIFASERTLRGPLIEQADGILRGRSSGERVGAGASIDR
jgi:hypothetical protein